MIGFFIALSLMILSGPLYHALQEHLAYIRFLKSMTWEATIKRVPYETVEVCAARRLSETAMWGVQPWALDGMLRHMEHDLLAEIMEQVKPFITIERGYSFNESYHEYIARLLVVRRKQ